MNIGLGEVNELWQKTIDDNKKFLLELEIKKANGNYDEYIEDFSSEFTGQQLSETFDEFSRSIPANSNLPQFN